MVFKLTVIIPTFNSEKSIERTISSIQNQTIGFENIELIIVDDHSNDSTMEILNKYKNDYSNVKCIFNDENTGTPSNSRNIGIDNASSEYVMFLDDDDIYVDDMCETMYNAIKRFDVDLVLCDYKTIINNQFCDFNLLNKDLSSFIQSDPKENKRIFLDNFVWNKIIKLDFIKKHDLKTPIGYWGEDLIFCIKSYLNTDSVVYLDGYQGILYNIRDEEGNLSSTNSWNINKFTRLFNGYLVVVKMLNEFGNQSLIDKWMDFYFTNMISFFVRLDADKQSKVEILEDMSNLKKLANFNQKLSENWAEIINANLEKKNFNFIIFYSKIINGLYSLSILRKVYRIFYNKLK